MFTTVLQSGPFALKEIERSLTISCCLYIFTVEPRYKEVGYK